VQAYANIFTVGCDLRVVDGESRSARS
jgi:hypothetical protein